MSIGGSRSRGIGTGTSLRGPAKETGDARADQMGSVRTLRPSHWMRNELCPSHVIARSLDRSWMDTGVRGVERVGKFRTLLGFARERVSAHLRIAPNPFGWACGHGFRKPPFWWWIGAGDISIARFMQFPNYASKGLLIDAARIHSCAFSSGA
jgi:hypothetical protein